MEDLKCTLIQSELFWEDRKRNLGMFSEKITSITDTDLIILPEMFATGFTMNAVNVAEEMTGESVTWMANMAKEKNCVITGSLVIKENNKFHNRLIWMQPDGKFETYDKRHLFSYAGEHKTYTAGCKKILMKLKGWNILPLICYDLRFPVWSRRSDEFNYDLLIYVANWPERRIHAWKQLLIARAIENQCYVAGVNRIGDDGNKFYHSGDSSVINYMGEYAGEKMKSNDETMTFTLAKEPLIEFRKHFAFFEDRDPFEVK